MRIANTNAMFNLRNQAEAFKEQATNARLGITNRLADIAGEREERAETEAPAKESLMDLQAQYLRSQIPGGAPSSRATAKANYLKKHPDVANALVEQALDDMGL